MARASLWVGSSRRQRRDASVRPQRIVSLPAQTIGRRFPYRSGPRPTHGTTHGRAFRASRADHMSAGQGFGLALPTRRSGSASARASIAGSSPSRFGLCGHHDAPNPTNCANSSTPCRGILDLVHRCSALRKAHGHPAGRHVPRRHAQVRSDHGVEARERHLRARGQAPCACGDHHALDEQPQIQPEAVRRQPRIDAEDEAEGAPKK